MKKFLLKIWEIIDNIFLLPEEDSYEEFFLDKTIFYKDSLEEFYLDKVIVSLSYCKKLQKDLKNFKYRYNKLYLEKFISYYLKLLEDNFPYIEPKDYIITGVPMFFLSQIHRWYNQTYILWNEFSKKSSIPFKKLLIKYKYTKKQAWLNKKDRLQNIKNCFKINKRYLNLIKWKNVILIDDVISTWSTANEIAKILKQNWVNKVFGLFLATSK